jgi:hypothetical protein
VWKSMLVRCWFCPCADSHLSKLLPLSAFNLQSFLNTSSNPVQLAAGQGDVPHAPVKRNPGHDVFPHPIREADP